MRRIKKVERELNMLGAVSMDSLKSEKVTGVMKCTVGHYPQGEITLRIIWHQPILHLLLGKNSIKHEVYHLQEKDNAHSPQKLTLCLYHSTKDVTEVYAFKRRFSSNHFISTTSVSQNYLMLIPYPKLLMVLGFN